ncbi:MAG TPA: ATP-binding protein [Acidobacteriota bacterium]
MTVTSAQIRDNPWWKRPELVREDPDLVRLAAKSVRYEHPIPFALRADAVYTLRGPRQVGKSTLLKRIIANLLLEQQVAPRSVLYLDVEGAGIRDAGRLADEVGAFLDWSHPVAAGERRYLLLDEVTGVPDWGTFVRLLHGRGRLAGTVMIVTGSHALDLRRGGEMAPGRRGEELGIDLDWVMRPLGFREYAQARDPDLKDALGVLDPASPEAAHEAAAEVRLHRDRLSAMFDRYLLTGGFPHAFTAEHDTGSIPVTIYRLFRDAMIGQMRRAGHREPLFLEILAWAGDNRLGREFSWRDVAAETEIGGKDTARSYLEDAEAMFLWHIFYRTKSLERLRQAPRSPKKLYPADPFVWHSLASWAGGERDPWAAALDRIANPASRGELVESVVADHMRRISGRDCFYYRTRRGEQELDFAFLAGGREALLEVKYRRRITGSDQNTLATHGGGIVATRDQYEWDAEKRIALIPVPLLLAGLEGAGSLVPSEGS